MLHALAKVRGSAAGVDQLSVQQLRIEVRDHAARAQRLALIGHDAHRAAGFDDHFAHRARHADFDAALGRGLAPSPE